MGLAGNKKSFAQSILSGRDSIPWEPSSRSTMIPDFSKGRPMVPPFFAPSVRSTICPSSVSQVNELDVTADSDKTVIESEQYHALLDIIQELRDKLQDERQKGVTLERDLRKELCEEFNK